MLSFLIALCLTLFAVNIAERFAKPKGNARPFLHRLDLLSIMPPVVLFCVFFMISYRPAFSGLATLVTFAGIVIVNNAKFAILREPLVFSDFALLRLAIRFPALYIRYVGVGKVVGITVAAVAVTVASVALEPPVIRRTDLNDYFPVLLYLATVLGLIYAVTRGPFRRTFGDLLRRFGPTANVSADMDKLSLVVCLIFYFLLANEPEPKAKEMPKAPPAARKRGKPKASLAPPSADVVCVQSESFFDARRLGSCVPADLLERYDARAAQALFHGRLAVPAWGANTMRSEFAFLSGLPNESLGYHSYNPYLTLCKQPVWTMAHLFRSMGYRTICVHPFHATFFDRDTVIPNLGFDRFLDLESFAGAPTFGPYVSDVAVAGKIRELLDEDCGQPKFIFAITMENHGSWEADRLDDFPADDAIEPAPLGSVGFGHYLRHLRHTDDLVEMVTGTLESRAQPGVFCLFGDHQPPLGAVFEAAGHTDPRTDYMIWRKGGAHPQILDTSVDVLGRLVIDAAFKMAAPEVPAEQAPTPAAETGATA